jgi:hypothetical protein
MRKNNKHTPYGAVYLSGQFFRRKDTLHQANQLAATLRRTFAHAGLHPTIEVKPYSP